MHPFIGSDAIARGQLTRAQLRWKYSAIHPNVYLERGAQRTLAVNVQAAALWAAGAIVTGRAAAALHGVRWLGPRITIDLIGPSRRPRPAIAVRAERISADEIVEIDSLLVATPARAALDIARHFLPSEEAVACLDALLAATGIGLDAVAALAARYAGARGVKNARSVLALVDSRAQSPKETWLRLLLIDAGFPRPHCQIKVQDGSTTAFIDMGWDAPKIGVEYDGDQHHSTRTQYVRDIGRYEMLERQGWLIIRVVREHSRGFIVHRVRAAFAARAADACGRNRHEGC